MSERHLIQIFMPNQQAAIVLGEKIALEHGVIVDVLHRNQIATIHPPMKPSVLDPTADIPVVAPHGWADAAIKEISGEPE